MRLGMDLILLGVLQIDYKLVLALYKRYVRTGNFTACKRSDRPQCRKLDGHHELLILGLLMENPAMYLIKICAKIQEVTGTTVSGATVCRLLQKHGYTRKKIRQVAKQRCEELRELFMARVFNFPRDFLVWCSGVARAMELVGHHCACAKALTTPSN